MKTGKALVERLETMEPPAKWRKFAKPGNPPCPPFSTANFFNVKPETIMSLMPLEPAEGDHFNIEVSSAGILIYVFCNLEDAPDGAAELKA
jgi:hypothetical protein